MNARKRSYAVAAAFTCLGILAIFFASGCASSPPIAVSIASPASPPTIQAGQTSSITASVSGDSSNRGVTWALSGQGTLSNQTSTTVTYDAPASVTANVTATVTATSVADITRVASLAITVTPAPISVTIVKKVSTLDAGTFLLGVQFAASVKNDSTGSGVTWTLTANGAPCSPACGSLSNAFTTFVDYNPPPSVPSAPNNAPTITATSFTDPTKSDSDAFTIIDGSTACGTGGNESMLNGEYAILLQGWTGSGTGTPVIIASSFGADGAGKITGGIIDVNHFTSSVTGALITAAASSYSVGPDNRGCLALTDNLDDTITFHFALGAVNGGIASKGDVIEFDDTTGTGQRASGILRLQNPAAFSLNALQPNYAFGVDGWEDTSGSLTHFALIGSFAQSAGNLSNASFDANDSGHVVSGPGALPSTGTIQAVSTITGNARATLNIPGDPQPANVDIFVIDQSELFIFGMDISSSGIPFSGRAIATASSFAASSVSPGYIFRTTGGSSGSASASIGLANFSGSGAVSEVIDQYAMGIANSQNFSGTFTVATASGRVPISNSTNSITQILYLTNPVDGISAFSLGTGATASLGVFDTQPAATYSASSLSGSFFLGNNEPGDNTVPNLAGVLSISAGNFSGTEDSSGSVAPFPVFLFPGARLVGTLSINANGSGSIGTGSVAVTNGTTLYFIDEKQAAAEVTVVEP